MRSTSPVPGSGKRSSSPLPQSAAESPAAPATTATNRAGNRARNESMVILPDSALPATAPRPQSPPPRTLLTALLHPLSKGCGFCDCCHSLPRGSSGCSLPASSAPLLLLLLLLLRTRVGFLFLPDLWQRRCLRRRHPSWGRGSRRTRASRIRNGRGSSRRSRCETNGQIAAMLPSLFFKRKIKK